MPVISQKDERKIEGKVEKNNVPIEDGKQYRELNKDMLLVYSDYINYCLQNPYWIIAVDCLFSLRRVSSHIVFLWLN